MPGFDLGLARARRAHPRHRQGSRPARLGGRARDVAASYIDIVKLGWGTAYVTQNLERKLDVLREKRVVIGGTFFEVVDVKDAFEEYKRWLQSWG